MSIFFESLEHHSYSEGLLESNHMDQLKASIQGCDSLRLIAIIETWLRNANTNQSIGIDGFKVMRSDRVGRRGDRGKGVGDANCLNTNYKYKLVLNSNRDNLGLTWSE